MAFAYSIFPINIPINIRISIGNYLFPLIFLINIPIRVSIGNYLVRQSRHVQLEKIPYDINIKFQ